jgi:uncharacterized protein YbaR (Trm112 family)
MPSRSGCWRDEDDCAGIVGIVAVSDYGQSRLQATDGALSCERCQVVYSVRDGIACLIPEEATLPAGVDRLRRAAVSKQEMKKGQSMPRDFYEVLGVARDASDDQVKKPIATPAPIPPGP